MQHIKQGRQAELQEQQARALTKLDRALTELEQYAGQRVKQLENVMRTLSIETLKSIVYDVEAAQTAYNEAQRELDRLEE